MATTPTTTRSLSSKIASYTAIFLTILIIGLFVCFYLWHYVSTNEEKLNKRQFRALDRIAYNMNQRIPDYFELAKLKAQESYERAFKETENRKDFVQLNANFRKLLEDNAKEIYDLRIFNLKIDPNADTNLLDSIVEINKGKDSVFVGKLKNETYVIFIVKVDSIPNGEVFLGIKVSRYLPKLLRTDYFNSYMLIKSDKIIYSNFPHKFVEGATDSLLESTNAFKARKISNIKFDETNYTIYSIPFSIFNENDFVLCGAIPTDTVNNEKLSIPGSFIFSLLFLLLSVAIAFPFLKLFMMSQFEKLSSFDILLSLLSLTFGSGLLFFVLIDKYQNNFVDKKGLDEMQIQLTKDIKENFIKDLTLANNQLSIYDSTVKNYPQNIRNLVYKPAYENDSLLSDDFCADVSNRSFYTHFKLAFWLDSTGNDLVKWVNADKMPGNNNYSDRDYFKNIRKGALYKMPGNPKDEFTIQPIRSWTDGEFRAVLAKRSINTILNDKPVSLAAISCRLPSVISSVMPYGYKFCIVNDQGEVWFHSDVNLNLNENIISECTENKNLVAAITSRTSIFFDEMYSGAYSRIRIEPIAGLPLYVITIKDTATETVKAFKIFLVSFGFLLLILLITGIHFMALLLFSIRDSKLKANWLRLDWLWPDYKNTGDYKRFLLINCVMFVATLLITIKIPVNDSPGFALYLIIFNCFMSITTYYFIQHHAFFKSLQKKTTYRVFKIFVIFYLAAFIFGPLLNSNTERIWGIVYVVFVILLSAVIFRDHFIKNKIDFEKAHDISENEIAKSEYVNWFSLMLMSWIVLMAFVPILRYYILAYDVESEISARQIQLSWVNSINDYTNPGSAKADKNFIFLNSPDDALTNIYKESEYFNSTINTSIKKTDQDKGSNDEGRTIICFLNRLLKLIYNKPSTNGYMAGLFENQDAVSYKWTSQKKGLISLAATDGVSSYKGIGDSMEITTTYPVYRLPGFHGNESGYKVFLFWLFLILSFIGIFFVIRTFILKLFIPNYFKSKPLEPVEKLEKLFMLNKERIANGSTQLETTDFRFIVVGLPKSGIYNYFNTPQRFEGVAKHTIDFLKLSNEDNWQEEIKKVELAKTKDIIICMHFEYASAEEKYNFEKFKLIELLTEKKFRHIILISTIHPSGFLNQVVNSDQNISELTTDVNSLVKNNQYHNWTSLLSTFEVIHYPLESVGGSTYHFSTYESWVISNECNHGLFLKGLKKQLKSDAAQAHQKLSYEQIEEFVLKVQALSYNYYLNLWNTLTREEQYVLYDLAEDGLVNYKNFESLTKLYIKGLIIDRGRPEVMNRSFRNFILTEVKKTDPVADANERAKNSPWNTFKTPFYLVLLFVLFFIFYTQQDSFNALTTILTGFTAFIPLLTKFMNVWTPGKPSA